MTAISLLPSESEGHIESALPWYVNGTLPDADRASVETHLSGCAQCRASHHLESLLHGRLRPAHDALENTEKQGWEALLPKLDLQAVTRVPRTPRLQRHRLRKQLTPLLLLAQACAIAVLAVALFNISSDRDVALYRTLTEQPRAESAAIPTLRVVFADDTTSATIRNLLLQIGGTISAGPSASNVYTVKLPHTQGAPARRPDDAAKWLRSQEGVLFAEAVESHTE
jgi:hypothetical protein